MFRIWVLPDKKLITIKQDIEKNIITAADIGRLFYIKSGRKMLKCLCISTHKKINLREPLKNDEDYLVWLDDHYIKNPSVLSFPDFPLTLLKDEELEKLYNLISPVEELDYWRPNPEVK